MLLYDTYDTVVIWHLYLYILNIKIPVHQSFLNMFHHLTVPSLNDNTPRKHISAVYVIIGQNRSSFATTVK